MFSQFYTGKQLFVAVFLGCTSTGRVGLCFLWFYVQELPKAQLASGSGFKASQKTGQRLKVSSDRLEEAGNRTCDPWFTRHRFIPYTTAASLQLVQCITLYGSADIIHIYKVDFKYIRFSDII